MTQLEMKETSPVVGTVGEASPASPHSPGHRGAHQPLKIALLFVAGLIAAIVAALVYLLAGLGSSEAGEVSLLSQTEVTETLLRSESVAADLDLEFMYAPSWYYEWSRRELPDNGGDPSLVFYMFETLHRGELPSTLPDVELLTDQWRMTPVTTRNLTNAPHHRTTELTFAYEKEDGQPIDSTGDITVRVALDDGSRATYTWRQPMPHGLGVINGDEALAVVASPALSIGVILAIFGGMVTALSPCLLLLGTYYAAVLSGTAATTAGRGPSAERQLLLSGVFFVVGFTTIYTAGGAVAGFVGASVSRSAAVLQWSRPASIVAGIAVVLLGIRVASQAHVPMACKLPGFRRPARSGWLASALMGSTFAFGCLSCFSATVLTALLLYAGSTGSPIAGGLLMFVFSASVALAFVAAAVLVAKAARFSSWLTHAKPVIGGISAAVMVVFGVLMITYQYHAVTGFLLRLWS